MESTCGDLNDHMMPGVHVAPLGTSGITVTVSPHFDLWIESPFLFDIVCNADFPYSPPVVCCTTPRGVSRLTFAQARVQPWTIGGTRLIFDLIRDEEEELPAFDAVEPGALKAARAAAGARRDEAEDSDDGSDDEEDCFYGAGWMEGYTLEMVIASLRRMCSRAGVRPRGTLTAPPTAAAWSLDPPLVVRTSRHEAQGTRPSMEDYIAAVAHVEHAPGRSLSLHGVFDGHGGDVASAWVGGRFASLVGKNVAAADGCMREALWDTCVQLDKSLLEAQRDEYGLDDASGSTMCSVLLDHETGRILCANIGDSRALLCRRNNVAYVARSFTVSYPVCSVAVKCVQMCTNVYKCVQMCTNVYTEK